MEQLKEIKRLFILSKEFRVEWFGGDGIVDDYYGTTVHKKQLFQFSDTLYGAKLLDTVLHEILHALEADIEFGFSDKTIGRLAATLASVLYENFDIKPKDKIK